MAVGSRGVLPVVPPAREEHQAVPNPRIIHFPLSCAVVMCGWGGGHGIAPTDLSRRANTVTPPPRGGGYLTQGPPKLQVTGHGASQFQGVSSTRLQRRLSKFCGDVV